MKVDVNVLFHDLRDVAALVRAAEEVGFDGLWTSETQHDPFLPLAVASTHTTRLQLGTAIAVAFARSPTVLAHTAWDLQRASRGRFILGLGTQVQAHIERRFGMKWEAPAPKLREMILAIRAVWRAWQEGESVNFRGEFYKITLMPPFFNPGPIEHPEIPIFIAGVNEHLCRVAGELCQGFHVHPFHTVEYIRQIVLPNITAGAARAARTRAEVELTSSIFVATNATERETVRAQIAFYASTPSYKSILDVHGWGETNEQLRRLAARQKWDEMPALVSDELLNAVAIVAPWDELPARIWQRYAGLLDRVSLYLPFQIDQLARWRAWVEAFKHVASASTG